MGPARERQHCMFTAAVRSGNTFLTPVHSLIQSRIIVCFVFNRFNHWSMTPFCFFCPHVDHGFSNGLRRTTRYWNGHSHCLVKRYYLSQCVCYFFRPIVFPSCSSCHLLSFSLFLCALLFLLHQEQMLQQPTSSVWLWPGTEWISLAITYLCTDTIYQWVVIPS